MHQDILIYQYIKAHFISGLFLLTVFGIDEIIL